MALSQLIEQGPKLCNVRTKDGRIIDLPDGVRAGDQIVCPNGHVIADAIADVQVGSYNWGSKFRFRGEPVPNGTHPSLCICPQCGVRWLYPDDAVRIDDPVRVLPRVMKVDRV